MSHHREFGRYAPSYERYRLIQARVAASLASTIKKSYSHVVDLGCGSGGFFRAYERPFTKYFAIDLSPEMLALHPDGEGVEKWLGDFNDPSLYERLKKEPVDLVISASSLQWSEDLDATLASIASLEAPVALAIFTAGTFRTLHEIAGVPSPIRDARKTVAALRRHFDLQIDILKYELYFKDPLSMLRYIKRSGVSGGRRRLGVGALKKVMARYPHAYLEFEVVRAVSAGI